MNAQQLEYKGKGNEFFKAKQFEQAIEWYSKAIDVDPRITDAAALYSNRAASYVGLGTAHLDKAIRDADACIALRPEWVKGYFRKAAAFEAKGDIDMAEKWYTQALSKEKENQDISKKVQYFRDRIADRNKSMTPAKCKTAAEAKTVGNSFFKLSNYENACAYYTRALELSDEKHPERHIFYTNRAICHAQQHNFKQTIVDCNDAVDCASCERDGKIKALLRRGLAFEGLEKWKQALADFTEVNQIAPGTLQATQGVQRCRRMLS